MSLTTSTHWMYNAGAASFYDFPIEQSLRFSDNDAPRLNGSLGTPTDAKKGTISVWIKRSDLPSANRYIMSSYNGSSSASSDVYFDTSHRLVVSFGGSSASSLVTNQVFRDVSAWFHLCIVLDSTQGTSSNRNKIYINGERVTSFSSANYPALNQSHMFSASGTRHRISTNWNSSGTLWFDGYMAEFHFVDGQALDPTDFGEFKSGIWIAKEYAGTYGNNGWYLDFANSADIGNDVSGNNNDWTPVNLTASDVVLDSPTNNFCTYNPNSRFDGNGSFSEGNLRFSGNSSGDMSTRTSTVIPAGMKFYFEAIYNEEGGSGGQARLGIDQTGSTADREKSGTGLFSFDFRGSAGTPQADDEGSLTTYGSQPAEGNVVGIAVDLENGKLYAHKANSYYNSGDPVAGTGAVITGIPDLQSVVFMSIDGGVNYNSWHINFGQDSTFAGRKSAGGNADENGLGDFAYAPPSGFLSLCSANLPEPAIDPAADETPEDYFNTVLWTGNGTTNTSITSVGFQPSLTWIKQRSGTEHHQLTDAVRGAPRTLATSGTFAENNNAERLKSFDADGFTLGNDIAVNQSSKTYVGWNWKAGGSGVSNTDGSITSTVSVGATSQQNWFSIIGYQGNGTAGATVGHGLGVTPDLLIMRRRSPAEAWPVWVGGAGFSATEYMRLNADTGKDTATSLFNSTLPTSSVVTLGNGNFVNTNASDYIMYAFANAEGLCKVGSYTGNGSSDGTFIYTGFRPAFVIVKKSSSDGEWVLWDNKRSGYNVDNDFLYPNTNNSEYNGSTYVRLDLTSNGFKMRDNSADTNGSGATYIYLAFAEQPFKYANAR